MRYSVKLRNKLWLLKSTLSPEELRELLVCIHIHSTSTSVCSKLFNVDEQIIISTLKEENMFEYKICSGCDRLLHYCMYYTDKQATGGVSPLCPNCHRLKRNQYRNDHREEHRQTVRNYYWKNRDKILARTAEARKKPEFQKWLKEWTDEYIKRPDVIAKRRERDRIRNTTNSKHRVNKHFRENLRTSLLNVNSSKTDKWANLVNYTLEDLMLHLESQFTEYMNWDNYGTFWVIDHIVPISKFKFSSSDDIQFKLCWSLKNLQPLESELNRQKYDLISEEWGNVELAKEFGVL